jgi:hypothetical protein
VTSAPSPSSRSEPGALLLPVVAVLAVWQLFAAMPWKVAVAGGLAFLFIALHWRRLTPGLQRMALALGLATAAALPLSPAPWNSLLRGMALGTLMAALITSVSMLARVALRTRHVEVVTTHLLAQGARSRYFSFSVACQVFGGMLGFAGVNLLLNMAARDQDSPEDDRISMFVAITRSFSAATLWSPMFSNTAILLALYPGLSSFAVLPLGIGLAGATVAIGQGLDLWRLRGRVLPASAEVPGAALRASAWPMLAAMGGFLGLALAMAWALHLPVAGAIICLAPPAALLLQLKLAPPGDRVLGIRRLREDIRALPALAGEVTLFMMAGCGGTVIASAIPPAWTAAVGALVSHQPMLAVLALMLSVVGLASIAVHPVLSAVLVASSFPPAMLHLLPLPHLGAILVGWAVAGAFTPFSMVNLMASRYANLPVLTLSTRANHWFALLCLVLGAFALGGISQWNATP